MSIKSSVKYQSLSGKKYATAGVPTIVILNSDVKTLVTTGRTRNGTANPKWKSMVRDGLNASTPFTGTEDVVLARPIRGVIDVQARSTTHPEYSYPKHFECNGYFTSVNIPSVLGGHHSSLASLVDADAIAVRRLHKEIDRVTHQFMGGVFVGQIGQALRMVLKPAKTLRSSMASYFTTLKKRGSGVKPAARRKILSDTYLEYTFGWQPLLSDCRDAAIALARLSHNVEKSKFKVRGEILKQASQSVAMAPVNLSAVNFIFNKFEVKSSKACVYYYGSLQGGLLNSDGAYSKVSNLQSLCGFDLQSFAPTAWELVPWSFVIDYFSNVGDVISAYTHNTSIVKWLSRATTLDSSTELRVIPDYQMTRVNVEQSGYPFSVWSVSLEAMTARSKATYRSVARTQSAVPFPALHFEIPGFDSMKWVNLAALALGAKPRSPYF